MKIDTEGVYTLQYTAEDECGNETIVERTVNVAAPKIYGVEWAGTSNPKWVRTDASADFPEPQPAVANGDGSSPFDDIMPWSGMSLVEDANAGTLVAIPKYWYKITSKSSGARLIQIANQPLEGFVVSPAHRDRGDGAGERDVVYVGRYFCANDYKSKAGVQPLTNKTRNEYRNGIAALGNDIWQYDFSMYWTIVFLYLVEFATWNSQAAIGYGCGTTYPNAPNTGSTDAMQYHTGTDAATRGTYGNVQYRHIEGLWSGLYFWVDGILLDWRGTGTRTIYEYSNPAQYNDDYSPTDSKAVASFGSHDGVPVGWRVQDTLYPKLTPEKGNTQTIPYTQYSCDSMSADMHGGTYALRMGGLSAGQGAGLFNWQGSNSAEAAFAYVGARLQKLPSA